MCKTSSATIFLKIVKEEKGESYHLKKGDVEMEVIMNLCASEKVVHKDHVRKT
jgi:hypothetical protein